jgi:urease accessory protein
MIIDAPAGEACVRAVRRGEETILSHVRANSPLHLLTPRTTPATAWVVAATFGGGLVGGDRIRLELRVESGARLLVSSQASTKLYRSPGTVTRQTLHAHVAREAVLAVLPDPTVPFAGSSFEQRQQYHLDAGASLAALDWMTSGRYATGEHWLFDRYTTGTDISCDGRAIFHDRMSLDERDGALIDRMGQVAAYALMVIVGPAFQQLASELVAATARQPAARGAEPLISAAPIDRGRGAAVRVAASDVERASATLRGMLRPVVAILGCDPWARRGTG